MKLRGTGGGLPGALGAAWSRVGPRGAAKGHERQREAARGHKATEVNMEGCKECNGVNLLQMPRTLGSNF
jgi:hypothetical protein